MKSVLSWKEYKLIVGWVFLTSIGCVLGEVFLGRLAFRFVPLSFEKIIFDSFGIMLGVATGIITGFSVGTFQWLILRKYITQSWLWITATS